MTGCLPRLRTSKQITDELEAGGCDITIAEFAQLVKSADAWIYTDVIDSPDLEDLVFVSFVNYDKLKNWLENNSSYRD